MGFVLWSFLGVRRSKREAIGQSHLGENSFRDEAHHHRSLSHAASITALIQKRPTGFTDRMSDVLSRLSSTAPA
jgi:hypothetical protein